MPELAEVETVRNTLKSQILKKRIIDIEVFYSKMIENDLNEFKNNLINDSFTDILRKGKYLIFETENNYLISHLRMEGKFFIKKADEDINKHEHLIFYFSDFTLRYHDTRKFGRMKLIKKEQLDNYFKNIGPDANSDIDKNYLFSKINKKNIPIKTLLLDQSIIAGLGNIYVDEVLYLSKINPYQKGIDLTLKDCENILKSAKEILNKAIEYKGTTIKSYTSSLGVYGSYQQFLNVHTKDRCCCNSKILKERIGGRSTYYCPNCQKLKK